MRLAVNSPPEKRGRTDYYAGGSEVWLADPDSRPVPLDIRLRDGSVVHADWRRLAHSEYMRSVFRHGWTELKNLPVWEWGVEDPEAAFWVLRVIGADPETDVASIPSEMLIRMAVVASMYGL